MGCVSPASQRRVFIRCPRQLSLQHQPVNLQQYPIVPVFQASDPQFIHLPQQTVQPETYILYQQQPIFHVLSVAQPQYETQPIAVKRPVSNDKRKPEEKVREKKNADNKMEEDSNRQYTCSIELIVPDSNGSTRVEVN